MKKTYHCYKVIEKKRNLNIKNEHTHKHTNVYTNIKAKQVVLFKKVYEGTKKQKRKKKKEKMCLLWYSKDIINYKCNNLVYCIQYRFD